VIQEDASLSKDVKLIGIAMGNEKAQVDAFKKSLKAVFPIFPDDTMEIAGAVEVPETPSTVIVSNSGKMLSCHRGPIKDFDAYLKEVRAALKAQ
jgi:hypothetical protein